MAQHLYQFALVVKNDKDNITIKTVAASKQAAKNAVVLAEGCPETAIISCKSIKQYY